MNSTEKFKVIKKKSVMCRALEGLRKERSADVMPKISKVRTFLRIIFESRRNKMYN